VAHLNYTDTTSSASGFSMSSYLLDNQVSRAEILYCLKIVKSHASMRSADDSHELFRAMFPDSKVAEKFSLGKTKASYLINYGLAKFFAKQLEDKLKSTESFVICFDESMNRVVQRGQMDLVVRYFDDSTNQVITKYLTSVFLGRATAADLLAKFKEGIAGLPRSKVMQISMDGPSVNWSFLDKYEDDLTQEDTEEKLLHIGSCGLHVINGAFQTGHQQSGWKINGVLRAMYRLFKDVPARRALFTELTGCKTFPKKFCQIRWTANASVADAALKLYDSVCKFVKEERKLPKGLSSVAVIKESSADPLFKAKLACFASIAKATEGFLTKFQSPAPMAPFLYDDITDLMRNLMQRVVKSNVLEAADTPRKLIAIDLQDNKNLLSRDKVGIGIGAVSEMAKAKCSDLQKMEFQMQVRKFIIALIQKTVERSPLKYKATRAISCISPSLILYNRTTSEARMTDLLQMLHDLGRITSTEADDAKAKFCELCASAKSKHKEQFDSFNKEEQNLDNFYSKIFAGDEKQVPLWKVVKMVLILSHGNAAVESGFSVNKAILVENMEEETIVAQRIVFDAIRVTGMDVTKIDISKKMIGYVRQSHSAYQSAKQLKKEKQVAEEKHASEERKRKATIASLQQQKKQKLAELKAEAAAIDSKIASIELGNRPH